MILSDNFYVHKMFLHVEGVWWGERRSSVWTCSLSTTYEPVITSQWVIIPLSTQEWSTVSRSLCVYSKAQLEYFPKQHKGE